jgi:hypothetical protein
VETELLPPQTLQDKWTIFTELRINIILLPTIPNWYFLIPCNLFFCGLSRLTVEVSRSHTIRHTHTRPLWLLWTSDQLVAESVTYTTNTRVEHPYPQGDSNPRSQQSKRLHTYALDRTATAIGHILQSVLTKWRKYELWGVVTLFINNRLRV